MRHLNETYGIKKPPFYRTHSFQVFASFVIFSTLLMAVYGFFIFRQIKDFELTMMRFHVQDTMNFILNNENPKKTILFHDEFLTVYENIKDLPGELPTRLNGLDEGIYQTHGPHGVGGDHRYNVAIKKNPRTRKNNYYIFDEEDFENRFKRREKLHKAFRNGWGVAVILSIVIGFLNARRLISPGRRLVDKVLASDPENLPVDFSNEFKNDEIGLVATALERSMQRIRAFIEREKQLTRDASHELRTPVTVIKGAVELMQQRPESENAGLKRPLSRIERSVRDMEVLIEVMLIRAREEESLENRGNCNVGEVAEKVVEESRYLVEGKPVVLTYEGAASPEIEASEPELKMALSNLVRNAINYTNSGDVTVAVHHDCVVITDTGTGIDPEILDRITDPYVKGESSKGYGIGLSIVSRVCGKYGWKLHIDSSDKGTTFRIVFSQ